MDWRVLTMAALVGRHRRDAARARRQLAEYQAFYPPPPTPSAPPPRRWYPVLVGLLILAVWALIIFAALHR